MQYPRLLVMLIAAVLTSVHATPVRLATAIQPVPHPPQMVIFPGAVSDFYTRAFDAARQEIRIEICILGDRQILAGLQAALRRGVRAIVDREKYTTFQAKQDHLATYLAGARGGGDCISATRFFRAAFRC